MAERKKHWYNRLFRRRNRTAESAAGPNLVSKGVPVLLPDLNNAPLLKAEEVHDFLISVNYDYKQDHRLENLIKDSREYENFFTNTKIPSVNDPDYVEMMAKINAEMMRKNEILLLKFAEESARYFAESQNAKVKGKAELSAEKEKMGIVLKKLAENMQAQKAGIINMYDQTMDQYRNDPERLGEVSGKSVGDIYGKTNVYIKPASETEILGSGSLNTVYKVTVDGKKRVFKQGMVNYRSKEANDNTILFFQEREGLDVRKLNDTTAAGHGIEILDELNTANRDVAVSRLNQLFDLNVSVYTTLGRAENGELSSVMELSDGMSLDKCIVTAMIEKEEDMRVYLDEGYSRRIEADQRVVEEKKHELFNRLPEGTVWDLDQTKKMIDKLNLLEKEKKAAGENPNPKIDVGEFMSEFFGMDVVKSDVKIPLETLKNRLESIAAMERTNVQKEHVLNEWKKNPIIDAYDPALNESLMELAALDYICAHPDRHLGNYLLVQKDGKTRVQAIDNDTAFPKRKPRSVGEYAPTVMLEKNFPLVTPELKAKMLKVTPEQLKDSLTGLLSEQQIEVACDRLENLQKYFKRKDLPVRSLTREDCKCLQKVEDIRDVNLSYHMYFTTNYFEEQDYGFKEWMKARPVAEKKTMKEKEKTTFKKLWDRTEDKGIRFKASAKAMQERKKEEQSVQSSAETRKPEAGDKKKAKEIGKK